MKLLKKITAIAFKTRRRAAASLILVALGSYLIYRETRPDTGKTSTTVRRGEFVESVSSSGRIAAASEVTLNFPAPGKLSWIRVEKGSQVKAWQGLMGMDTTELNAAATAAWYNYLAADANAKEIEDAVKDHDGDETFAQKNLRVSAQTARDKAWDAWRVAQKALKDATLVSPISGVVTDITVTKPGDTISVTDGITVIDLSSVYFRAEVDEIDYARLKSGLAAVVELDAFPSETFSGKILKISQSGVETPGGGITIYVDIGFDSTNEGFIPGLNGEAQFILNKIEDTLIIPREYLLYREGKSYVNLREGGKVTQTEVELGASNQESVQILSGLSEGREILLPE